MLAENAMCLTFMVGGEVAEPELLTRFGRWDYLAYSFILQSATGMLGLVPTSSMTNVRQILVAWLTKL